ncbi:MAG TPA: DUF4922 domain-containing protein [Tepidisphaeraceae bacterium]
MTDLSDAAHQLLQRQIHTWKLLADNLATLAGMETRDFDFGGFIVKTQFNPQRLYSVSAKTDEHSVRNRKCFLCDENRPPEQESLSCGNGYKILCNPYPIFPEHFTIVHEQHQPQRIEPSFAAMLQVCEMLGSRYTIFYNGPQCGASAPDHLHFQASNRGATPLDREYDRIKRRIARKDDVEIFAGENYLRPLWGIESQNRSAIEQAFSRILKNFGELAPNPIEPLVNVFCSREDQTHRAVVFPRTAHRPGSYYADDPAQRLSFSPGAADMAGIVVMPVEQQFRRTVKDDLARMYREVCPDAQMFERITREFLR